MCVQRLVAVLVRMIVLVRMRMVVRVAVSMFVRMVVPVVSVPGQLQCREAEAGEDQDGADDGVLRALDRGAELQADGDDDGAEGDRDENVRDAREPRQPGNAGERVAAGAPDDRERHPVVGEDGVPEADAGGRGDQSRRGRAHSVDLLGLGRERVYHRVSEHEPKISYEHVFNEGPRILARERR
jgi:hypothetical protein